MNPYTPASALSGQQARAIRLADESRGFSPARLPETPHRLDACDSGGRTYNHKESPCTHD